MKHLLSTILLATVLLFGINAQTCKYLVWADEFNTDGVPNTQDWNYDIGYLANHEFQMYTNSANNLHIENGILTIEAIKDINSKTWTSGRLNSASKHIFTYGRIEFRAQIPIGDGTWPALWMLGQDIGSIG